MIWLISPWTIWLYFADYISKSIFLNVKISFQISLKLVPRGPIIMKKIQALVWRQASNKPLPEPLAIQFKYVYVRH